MARADRRDELRARPPGASIEDAWERVLEATEIEHQAFALQASTIRDLRRLMREMSALFHVPMRHVLPLTNPAQIEAFLAACNARIAEFAKDGGAVTV